MGQLLATMFSHVPGPALTSGQIIAAWVMLAAWLRQVAGERYNMHDGILALPLPVKALAYSMVAVLVLVLGSETPATFIYFRF